MKTGTIVLPDRPDSPEHIVGVVVDQDRSGNPDFVVVVWLSNARGAFRSEECVSDLVPATLDQRRLDQPIGLYQPIDHHRLAERMRRL